VTDHNSDNSSRYDADFKVRVVLEALTASNTDTSIASAFGIHPVTLSRWKTMFLRNASKVFSFLETEQGYLETIGELRQQLAEREEEARLLRELLNDALDTDAKIDLVEKHREKFGLNRICEILGVPKSTYYYRMHSRE
jgi:transposase